MSRTRHLLTVWNPSYAESAMDAHLEVLLGWADSSVGSGQGLGKEDPSIGSGRRSQDDDVYVWWAKLRSPNRQQPLPHRDDVLALQEQIDDGIETHLYLTDYRSLYVGLLDEIVGEELLAQYEDEIDHAPLYYRDRPADFWFRLDDIRLIVADDTVATIEELKKLRNTRYHDRPVSIYGGMVELPLIVTRDDEARWFDPAQAPDDGRLWAQRDAEMRSEVERLGRELRDNLLGRDVWSALEPASRTFLAAAEATFRARRDDPGFDFSGPAMSYAKAVETEVNALLFHALRRVCERLSPAERMVNVDGETIDLGRPVAHQTLGVLRNLLLHDDLVARHLKVALPQDWSWIRSALPEELRRLGEVRNPAAHAVASRREVVARLREEVLGIGREGVVVRVTRGKMRG